MSGRPLVPSKDALRALRHLAYSPPVALIGTAGALCGVAAIHYNERQKVHRAERILETKRKLHSISRGKGSTRLAHMFEAAERGEDFTINKGVPLKRTQRRRYSVSAAQHDNTVEVEWKTFNDSQADDQGLFDVDEEDEAQNNVPEANGPQYKFPGQSRRNELIRKIYNNSTNVPWDGSKSHSLPWSSTRRQRGGIVRRREEHTPEDVDLPQQTAVSNLRHPTTIEQSVTDLHPLFNTTDNHLIEANQSNKTESVGSQSILLELNSDWSLMNSAFGSIQPWERIVESDVSVGIKLERIASHDNKPELPDLYISYSAEVPAYKVEHNYLSRYDLNSDQVRKGMGTIGVERYAYVFANLMNFHARYGGHRAIFLLERAMVQYTMTGERSDFALAQTLFLDCVRIFSTPELKPVIWRFVEQFLHGDTPRLEVVSFLYPRCGAGVRSDGQHYHFLAHQYLEILTEKGVELDQQVIELRKIIAGTRMCEVEPHEHLIIPTLRALCLASRMTAAQAIFDEMVSVYKIKTTTYAVQVLIQGYARAGNWSKVKNILDEEQSVDRSGGKAYAMAGLLVSIVDAYAVTHSPERVVGFAFHCLREYNLQPVTELTRKIVGLCLRYRRYALITNWIRMVQNKYPHVGTGSDSVTFAFDVACIWRDIDASCDDILNGCRALASHALRDPFSKAFRLAIAEAVHQFMAPRLAQLREKLGPDVPPTPTGDLYKFHVALKSLKAKPDTKVPGSRARLLLSYLISQAEALRWINALCKGRMQPEVELQYSIDPDEVDWFGTRDKPPKLPAIVDIQTSLTQEYAQCTKSGLAIQHTSLKSTVAQLEQQGRPAHAFDLITSIYHSRWAQPPTGVEFDLDIFTEWVKLAWKLRSGSRLRTVLWAIVDASPQVQINGQLLLLARIAAPKAQLQKVKHAKLNEIDEGEYLRLRLKRRHWTATGEDKRLVLPAWKGFGQSSAMV